MNAKMIMLAVAVAVIGAAALMMCDDADAAAGDVLASGSCGDTLTYEVRSLNADDSQVELVISGSGAMTGWVVSSTPTAPWSTYRDKIINVTLPAGLTSIGSSAFNGCTALTSIEIPAGLTSIGAQAFYDCTALTSIELPAGLTSVGNAAFYHTALTSIELPAGLTSIGNSMFYDCTALTSIELPARITKIPINMAYGCTALTSIELPARITSIESSAFNGCTALTSIELPAGLTSIGSSAFNGCTALTSIELPAGLTSIGSQAFNGCTALTSIELPAIKISSSIGLTKIVTLTYTTSTDWTSSNRENTPQYTSRATLQSITFSSDYIPANALYGQNLDTLTITNASGSDVLGIYTAPNVKATASALTVDGTAAQIVRLTDVAGDAELVDGGITANDVNVHWDTSPDGYATGEVDASPELLVYPAGYHSREPNNFGVWMTAISILLVVGLLMAFVLPMIARRLE